ncbi:hypothetical protein LSH36_356g01036 [Paralvinella palmiformis]|uniref:Uncharacterized protein n=1 Tax=Paralvinella palmiformis TaxID=53620 RepID=A0AAD9JF85_9ANNE|nr:hypothetical protein LSH36_356g01036 [Paralvinella palmiformis]
MSQYTIADLNSCLDIYVVQEQNTWNIDPLAVGISFAVATIFGVLVALGCAKLCMKDFIRHKHQDAESGHRVHHHIKIDEKQQHHETQSKLNVDGSPHAEDKSNTGGRRKRNRRRKNLQSGSGREDGQESLLLVSPIILDGNEEGMTPSDHGLLDVLMKDSGVDMESELASQDYDAICRLEKEFREQNIDTMLQLLRTLLNKQLKKGKLTPEQSQELLGNIQNGVDHVIKTCQQEKDDEETELRKKVKDPEKLEAELDKINSKYNLKMTSMLQEEKEKLRHNLMKITELTDSEIDEMLAELTHNLANLENQLGIERIRQAKALEERLERRRLFAKQQRSEAQLQTEELQHRVESHGIILNKLTKDGKLQDRQKEEILSEYNDDLIKIQKKHEEEFQQQKLVLADKLRQRREAQMAKVAEQQETKKAQFFSASESAADSASLVMSYHQLLQQQRHELDGLNVQLDEKDAEEFRKLSRSVEKNQNVDVQKREEEFEEEILAKAQLTDRELDRLVALHQSQMEDFDAQKKAERKKLKSQMEEKLEQRHLQMQENQKLCLVELAVIKEQQDATIEKVLQSQVEISSSDKEKIMKEHEQNMSLMNNQLQMSRLKQQKLLDAKINKRQARVEDLKKQAQEIKISQQKTKEKQLAQLEKMILEEEAHVEEEKKKALIEARQRFVEETQLALAEQEKQLGLLIARLQVGQARRQVLIKKQDKAIKQLEEKLSSHVVDKIEATGNEDDGIGQVDQLLQQHMTQVSGLNDRLQEVKDRQNQILQEKLQKKRIMKESKASAVLEQVMLDTRHKMAMHQLECEMQAEMKQQREELNEELEAELQAELEAQKKSFLSQLAAIIDMSREEVNELVTSAVIETGGDSDEVQKLAKDMRLGLKRAKSQMSTAGYGDGKSKIKKHVSYGHEERHFYNDESYDGDEYGDVNRESSYHDNDGYEDKYEEAGYNPDDGRDDGNEDGRARSRSGRTRNKDQSVEYEDYVY